MKNQLSIVVITKNEQENIQDCLESIKWANEIILVDAQSTDRTVEIAKNYTDKIFVREWKGYSDAKNFGAQHANCEWIFFIDADERITDELRREIQQKISDNTNEFVAFMVARRTYFLGKWIKHCGWYPNYVIRMVKNGYGKFNELNVHERLLVNGKIGKFKNDLLHFTDKNLYQYFEKFNNYTTLAAIDLFDQNRNFKIKNLLLNPIFTFIRMYFLRLGFLDGIHGLVLCTLSSLYVFTKYAKLWEKSIINKENVK